MCFVAKLEKEAYCDEEMAKTEAKPDLELGLGGVQKALQGLRAYYGSAATMLQ